MNKISTFMNILSNFMKKNKYLYEYYFVYEYYIFL